VIVAVGVSLPSFAIADADPTNHSSMMMFDMPALPLETALERFMTATKVAVVADSTVIAGRTSAALHGSFSPDGALHLLLAGTGLVARPIGSGAFTLALLPDAPEVRPLPRFVDYAAALQRAVTSALCRRDETRPTHYRAVMRLWVSAAGVVTHVELASPTGDQSLDTAISDALQHIDIGMRTPSELPQPVKLAVMPYSTDAAACPSDGPSVPDLGH
jgi:hypothetical protein